MTDWSGFSPELQNGIFGITGAVIGSVLTFLLGWSIREKVAIKILTVPIDMMTEKLERVGFKLILDGKEATIGSIRKVEFMVLNVGNKAVKDLEIDVSLNSPGKLLSKSEDGKVELPSYSRIPGKKFEIHRFKYSYLNPKERVAHSLFFETTANDYEINCRQPDLDVSLVRVEKLITLMDLVAANNGWFGLSIQIVRVLFTRGPRRS